MLRADVISLVLGVTAFTLHTVGLGSPYWWFVAEDQALPAVTRARGATFDFHYGIWVIRECTNGTCSNVPSKMHGDRGEDISAAFVLQHMYAAFVGLMCPRDATNSETKTTSCVSL